MERVLVIGSPGAGKSTLARRIGDALGLPVTHLDREYWRPGWVEPAKAAWAERVNRLAEGNAWVIEGNYTSTLQIRIARATTVIWLDIARWRCMLRVVRRLVLNWGRVRPDMAAGCPERLSLDFLRFVWTFESRNRSRTQRVMERLRPDQQGMILRTPREVAAFEDRLFQPVAA
ncbi:P-loop NTPase family protein [Microvirga pudoricolor]|uniref:hypothetical protein n=1 Tax=Microvirga pudoricolor TaxID=2778729 RepID=UPI00194F957F|nr:hypothetical protein [Microvirga pudoricolor]MBM6595726.1 hypothetical protein [Microvirga pudoricolor]